MINTFAMAGPAEAAEYFAILLMRGLIGIAVILSVFGFFRRSERSAWIGLVIISIAAALVQPWAAFIEHPTPTDPDSVHWIAKWHVLSVVLISGFVLCVGLLISTVFRGRKKPILEGSDSPERESSPRLNKP